ncbi:MAG: Hpt domain-containing protein [Treponema sp.]
MSEIFDFNSVVELLMGDEVSARELLKSYLLQTEEQMKLLQDLLNDNDFANKRDEVRRKAHLIKGSSLNVSAKNLASTMLEMEKGALELSQDELLKLYSVGVDKFAILKNEINKS